MVIYICVCIICDTTQITKHRDIARTSAVKPDGIQFCFFRKSNIEKMTRKNGNCRTIPQGNDLDAVFLCNCCLKLATILLFSPLLDSDRS